MKKYTLKNVEKRTFLNLVQFFSDQIGTCVLYSGNTGRNSFLFLFPFEAFSFVKEKDIKTYSFEKQFLMKKDFLNDLEKALQLSYKAKYYPKWVGYFSYEFNNDFYRKENIKTNKLAFFQRSLLNIKFDHIRKELVVFFDEEKSHLILNEHKKYLSFFLNEKKFEYFIKNKVIDINLNKEKIDSSLEIHKNFESKKEYFKKIEIIKSNIKKGNVYEVNLSHEIILKGKIDPFKVFLTLLRKNPSPFSAYMNFNSLKIVSSSPERLLTKKGGKYFESKPIKGTINRGKDKIEDLKNLYYLMTSEKEKAELRMITDLIRNDLYPVSEKGSIEVLKDFYIEKYENVFQQLSIIRSKPIVNVLIKDIIRSIFPGGSITGCPKQASMEIIHLLEKRNRGVYTGSIGYFLDSGDFDLNIAIRTMQIEGDLIFLPVGGAITLDSDPLLEYKETIYKAKSLLNALNIENQNEHCFF